MAVPLAGALLAGTAGPQPNRAGSAPRWAAASSSRGTAKLPTTSRLVPPTVPSTVTGTECAAHRRANSVSDPGTTATTPRAADSLNRKGNPSTGGPTRQPRPPARPDSAQAA